MYIYMLILLSSPYLLVFDDDLCTVYVSRWCCCRWIKGDL